MHDPHVRKKRVHATLHCLCRTTSTLSWTTTETSLSGYDPSIPLRLEASTRASRISFPVFNFINAVVWFYKPAVLTNYLSCLASIPQSFMLTLTRKLACELDLCRTAVTLTLAMKLILSLCFACFLRILTVACACSWS